MWHCSICLGVQPACEQSLGAVMHTLRPWMSPCHRKSETQLDSELSLRLKLYECSMGCAGRPLGNFRRLERFREFEPYRSSYLLSICMSLRIMRVQAWPQVTSAGLALYYDNLLKVRTLHTIYCCGILLLFYWGGFVSCCECFGNLMFIHLLFSAIIIWHGVW